MRNRLLVLAALSVLPMTQVDAQRSRSRKDSSATAAQTLAAAAGIGGGLLALLSSSDEAFDGNSESWCVGACGVGGRGSFGFFVTPETMQGTPTRGSTSILRASPRRRAMLLETLDDALTRAGLRIVVGSGNSVWFGTDGSNAAFEANGTVQGSEGGAFGGTGMSEVVVRHGATPAGGSAPSDGCIIATCMLGEGPLAGSSLVGNSAALLLEGNASEALFEGDPSPQPRVRAFGDNVNIIVNPEPGTIALMLAGLAGLAFARRRTRSAGL